MYSNTFYVYQFWVIFFFYNTIFVKLNYKYLSYNFFRWFFALISISGLFSVTFSVVFAYVADVSDENERSRYYGWVNIYIFIKCHAIIIKFIFKKFK